MSNLTFEITVNYLNEDFSVTLENGLSTKKEILEYLKDTKKERFEIESGEDFEADLSNENEFEVTEDSEIPEWLKINGNVNYDLLTDLLENYSYDYDIDVYEAANDAGIQFSDVDECYKGQFSNDEDFAHYMAEQTGFVDKEANWPNNCIDWELAAKELMYDYSSANGHYFKNI